MDTNFSLLGIVKCEKCGSKEVIERIKKHQERQEKAHSIICKKCFHQSVFYLAYTPKESS